MIKTVKEAISEQDKILNIDFPLYGRHFCGNNIIDSELLKGLYNLGQTYTITGDTIALNAINVKILEYLERLLLITAEKGFKTKQHLIDYLKEYDWTAYTTARYDVCFRKTEPALKLEKDGICFYIIYYGFLRENILLKNKLFGNLVMQYCRLIGVTPICGYDIPSGTYDTKRYPLKLIYRRELPKLVKSVGIGNIDIAEYMTRKRKEIDDAIKEVQQQREINKAYEEQ